MSALLLVTKLFIPPLRSRERVVQRPRLIARLNEGLRSGARLTLICAPAGFGKTTLVSEWVHSMGAAASPTAVAWLSLDEGDNDPARFLAYFVAALSQLEGIEAPIGEGALDILRASQSHPPPTEAILTSLINDVAAIPDGIVFVLDDYHMIESSPVDAALSFLLEHLPPHTGPGGQRCGMNLVIATREDPYLPLARLRARGQLTELRAADLRFTYSEAAAFLKQSMGLDLSEEDIAALETRTEEWIAGLQLVAISLQGHKDTSSLIKSLTGSHRFVLDYLIEEVLSHQSESVQTFLLRTSVLDRLTGSLCDAVRFGSAKSPTGQDDGQTILGMLERANLFIVRLDEERRWYRYHRLFADLLRQRLHQIQPEQVSTLHLRASEWYEQNGFVGEATEHALRAEAFERAAILVEAQFDAMYRRGEHIKLRLWLAALPFPLVSSRPQLCILHAWNLFTSGQLDAAERSLQAAEKALEPSADGATETSPVGLDQLPDTDRLTLRGRVAAMRAFTASYRGDVAGTIRHARQALDDLPEDEYTWRSTAAIALGDAYAIKGEMAAAYQARLGALVTSKLTGDAYLNTIANLKLAITLRMQGQLQRVVEICKGQMQFADENGVSQTVVAGWLLAIWGEVLAELNELDMAIHQAKKGVHLTERGRDVAMRTWSTLCLVKVLFSREELAGAEKLIRGMEQIAREFEMPVWDRNQIAAWQARIWLAQGKLDAVSQWVVERGLDKSEEPTYLHEMEYIALARILLAQGRLDESVGLLQSLLEAAEAGGRTSRVIEILALQALAHQAGGDTSHAMAALERALILAQPGGFIRVFLDEGPPMARLLYRFLSRGIATDYVRRLLAAFPVVDKERTVPSKTQAISPEWIEPLSEREIEILQLIAEGLTNQEIASRLFLSLNTVKTHTRNIYGKFDVHSRTQAVARARALGVLPNF